MRHISIGNTYLTITLFFNVLEPYTDSYHCFETPCIVVELLRITIESSCTLLIVGFVDSSSRTENSGHHDSLFDQVSQFFLIWILISLFSMGEYIKKFVQKTKI